ncbi:hypothetical protein K431DRAFT_272460 [Polychaeton citri CBS 116435]|uniref:Uncharacterized protein n=1 Tax=Polychaeton citri CBS 116435 TaxID=1314669 RepID=A0A9P4UL08_9PEZI|nr:hypothetical protein K431DRAFT_272460 [Polychaeton citri CBS 116435]
MSTIAPPSLLRPVAPRALHIRTTPRPLGLAASRQVLRILEQFGEVEHFRSLKFGGGGAAGQAVVPNAALVIFREERAAEVVLRRSPVRFRVRAGPAEEAAEVEAEAEVEVEVQTHAPWGLRASVQVPQQEKKKTSLPGGQTRSISTASKLQSPTTTQRSKHIPHPMPRTSSRAGETIYQIEAGPAKFRFRDAVNQGHYHGSFPLDTKSAAQQDLAKKVPLVGLSCWNWKVQGKPWRVAQRERGRVGRRDGNANGKSLWEVWEEGLTRRGETGG